MTYCKRMFVGVVLISLGITYIIWFTAKPVDSIVPKSVKDQSLQREGVSYSTVNIEVCRSGKKTKKKATGNNQTVWSTRAVELREGCNLAQAQKAKNGQDGWRDILINRLIVNDRYKFLSCVVPTVASASIYRLLATLDGKTVSKNAIDKTVLRNERDFLTLLGTYSKEEREFRFRNYKKMILVREPMERLLSAYRARFGDTLSKMTDVSFAEFLQFIQQLTVEADPWFDIHWRRVFDFCFPCQTSYDTIVKYESLHEDMTLFLKEVGAHDNAQLPDRTTIYHNPKTSDVMLDYYKQAPYNLVKSLWNFYYVDAAPFGYEFPSGLCR